MASKSWSGGSADQAASGCWQQEWCQWWQCGHCHGYTKSPGKKCNRCGIKKSWAQIVSDGAGQQHAPRWNNNGWHHHATPTQHKPSEAPQMRAEFAPPMAPQRATLGTQEHLATTIKSLEAAFAVVPQGDSFDSIRKEITDKISFVKRSVTQSKPVGAQLDSCRSAAQRAESRKANAEAAIAAAQKQWEEAEADHMRLVIELSQLESQVAPSQPTLPANSVETMVSALTNVLADMKSSAAVSPELIADAENHMALLLSGIQEIARMAQTTAAAQAAPGAATTGCPDALMESEDANAALAASALILTSTDPYDPQPRRTAIRAKIRSERRGFTAPCHQQFQHVRNRPTAV
ncbi:unnamed protein product [Polarella glacialis]|uniref:Uncharacterized protein n=1 Tax=Polarella glacialis TaxID=89957 RepID=A0A813GL46_POLGL|nr:unnamed protein product [Polarella glacialis]CAE8636100.1 unnamed protein product [Polarella glacialis]